MAIHSLVKFSLVPFGEKQLRATTRKHFSHGQDNLKDNGAQGPMKAQRAGGGLKTGPNVTGGRQNARHHHPPKTTNHPTYTRVSRLQDPDLISLTLGLL